jgi:hypothetical protein
VVCVVMCLRVFVFACLWSEQGFKNIKFEWNVRAWFSVVATRHVCNFLSTPCANQWYFSPIPRLFQISELSVAHTGFQVFTAQEK